MYGLCSDPSAADLDRNILHPYRLTSIHISPSLIQSYSPQCSMRSMFLPYSVQSPNIIMILEKQVVISHLDHHPPSVFPGVLTQEFGETIPSFFIAISWLAVTRLVFCLKDLCLKDHPKTILGLAQCPKWSSPRIFLASASSRMFVLGLDYKGQHMEMRQSKIHTVPEMQMVSTHVLETTDACTERNWLF